ncbi:hypothetical protein KI387_035537, partial [Taxus chinensis]
MVMVEQEEQSKLLDFEKEQPMEALQAPITPPKIELLPYEVDFEDSFGKILDTSNSVKANLSKAPTSSQGGVHSNDIPTNTHSTKEGKHSEDNQ